MTILINAVAEILTFLKKCSLHSQSATRVNLLILPGFGLVQLVDFCLVKVKQVALLNDFVLEFESLESHLGVGTQLSLGSNW